MGYEHVGIPTKEKLAIGRGIIIEGVFAPEACLRWLVLITACVVGATISPLGMANRCSRLLQIAQHIWVVALELSNTRIGVKTVTRIPQFSRRPHTHLK